MASFVIPHGQPVPMAFCVPFDSTSFRIKKQAKKCSHLLKFRVKLRRKTARTDLQILHFLCVKMPSLKVCSEQRMELLNVSGVGGGCEI